jgi:hypothetical protein
LISGTKAPLEPVLMSIFGPVSLASSCVAEFRPLRVYDFCSHGMMST